MLDLITVPPHLDNTLKLGLCEFESLAFRNIMLIKKGLNIV